MKYHTCVTTPVRHTQIFSVLSEEGTLCSHVDPATNDVSSPIAGTKFVAASSCIKLPAIVAMIAPGSCVPTGHPGYGRTEMTEANTNNTRTWLA